MQLSYAIEPYRECVRRAFCELLLQDRYASELPNINRFTKFLTRIKESDPSLDLPELCATGLPPNWAYIQYNRGPLQIVDDDEFRKMIVREDVDEIDKTFVDETLWGYGKTILNFWLVANSGAAIEAAEALFYMRLYKIKSIFYEYQCINWKSRVIHESLQSFDSIELNELGTGFTITWSIELFVPVLMQEVGNRITIQEVTTNIYDASDLRVDNTSNGRDTISETPGGISGIGGNEGLLPNQGPGTDLRCNVLPSRTRANFDRPTNRDKLLSQVVTEGDGTLTENVPPVFEEDET